MKKRITSLIHKFSFAGLLGNKDLDKTFAKYTLMFLGMMLVLYLFFLFGNMSGGNFAYSEF
ncbi:MAG: hypothetical protein Q4E84_00065 [Clostridia bacterium]|nr:hypothetical protein [Clostridia bacterium]MDO5302282.1 hypothetical protein [Clostridia bacterium]